ncbi:hypothetical protein TSUD_409200 [Trifolium subterraneum]|uniref:Amino acid transporter transmembrane domain-containing protein n=1 Tax=Trifolium subterraneum TaxID=3900 RepID=A0A2Z6P1L0_TRISU|nr:hypothetical protein TSUD_409200 [Trifolium subterraneum]
MKNSSSDQCFFIESDNDEDKELGREENNVGNESDFSCDSNENLDQRKPSSYSMAWPQSYRQSIDLYGSVPSPNIGFLGTTSLTRLGSSFLGTTLTRRNTAEIIPTIKKPLIQPAVDEEQQHTTQALLPPLPSRKSSVRKSLKISHEVPIPGQCSFGQAVLNGMNALCGVGILSTPYALNEGGWAALGILLTFAALSFYTGLLLRYCLDSEPGLETYPDIGQAAFGTIGRVAISACCIEYIILESDNLSSLFPDASLILGGFKLNAHILFAILATLAILPTVWLRDLRILSYISGLGVIATAVVVLCLVWVGVVDDIPISTKGTTTLKLSTFPVAMGLCGYCFSGHAVFPNLYTAMANRNQFPAVLLTCFAICTSLYCLVAVLGYLMFGEDTESQYTLNIPRGLIAYKIAIWTTSLILPAACFLSIKGRRLSRSQVILCVTVIIVGIVSSGFGSYSAISEIIAELFP